MRALILCCLAAALPGALVANDAPEESDQSASPFAGRYNGNSFETAMGMEVLADGTWGWGLSVGALDMRANGTWKEKDGFLYLTSTPKPIAPEFVWSGLESTGAPAKDTPFIKVVWGSNGKPFQYANIELTCANGKTFSGQVGEDGYPSVKALECEEPLPAERDPRRSCDKPDTAVLIQSVHSVRSAPFKLAELGWEEGQTVRFAFNPNDLGVADFTGITGYIEDGQLILIGGEWPMKLRKMPPRKEAGDQ